MPRKNINAGQRGGRDIVQAPTYERAAFKELLASLKAEWNKRHGRAN